jgi:hypothetical protein
VGGEGDGDFGVGFPEGDAPAGEVPEMGGLGSGRAVEADMVRPESVQSDEEDVVRRGDVPAASGRGQDDPSPDQAFSSPAHVRPIIGEQKGLVKISLKYI